MLQQQVTHIMIMCERKTSLTLVLMLDGWSRTEQSSETVLQQLSGVFNLGLSLEFFSHLLLCQSA